MCNSKDFVEGLPLGNPVLLVASQARRKNGLALFRFDGLPAAIEVEASIARTRIPPEHLAHLRALEGNPLRIPSEDALYGVAQEVAEECRQAMYAVLRAYRGAGDTKWELAANCVASRAIEVQ
jgi:hypothetical protein